MKSTEEHDVPKLPCQNDEVHGKSDYSIIIYEIIIWYYQTILQILYEMTHFGVMEVVERASESHSDPVAVVVIDT